MTLQFVEIVGKRDAVVEFEAAGGLVVELEDAFAQIGPEYKTFTRELDDARPLVFGVGDPLDQTVALEAFQNTIEILPADDEEVGKRADGDP